MVGVGLENMLIYRFLKFHMLSNLSSTIDKLTTEIVGLTVVEVGLENMLVFKFHILFNLASTKVKLTTEIIGLNVVELGLENMLVCRFFNFHVF